MLALTGALSTIRVVYFDDAPIIEPTFIAQLSIPVVLFAVALVSPIFIASTTRFMLGRRQVQHFMLPIAAMSFVIARVLSLLST